MDDFPNDASTSGFYFVRDQPISGINEDFNDVDWIRVGGLKRWHFYNVWFYSSEVRPSFKSLDLVDSDGEVIEYLTRGFPNRGAYQHVHPGNEPLFVAASLTGGDYKIFIREEDDAPDTFSQATNFDIAIRGFHAGAIQSGDIDYVKFKLREGVEYTVDLLGADSIDSTDTTLTNPLLRVFSPSGTVVAADNDSGIGKNAQVIFTPEETAEYVFQIVGLKSTGSYVLQSNQLDDFGDNVNTTGMLPTDGTVIEGRSDFHEDRDWFRTEPLLEHYTYQFVANRVNDSGFAFLSLFDIEGELDSFSNRPSGATGSFLNIEPGESRSPFISVRSTVDYELTAQPFDLIGATRDDYFEMNFLVNDAIGVIEEPGDRDWFRKQMLAHGKYRIDATPLSGQPADTFEIVPQSFETEQAFEPIQSGDIFRPTERVLFFDIGASDGNTEGAYELKFTPLDAAPDNESTQWNVQLTNGKGRIFNALETFDDVDWHRIQLESDTWYEFDVNSGNIELDILRPDGTIVSLDSNNQRYYLSDQSGEHYLITQSQFASSVEIHISSNTKREVDSRSLYLKHFQQPNFLSLLGNVDGDALVQIHSELPLRYDVDGAPAVDLEANTVHTVTREIAGRLRLRQSQFVGTAEVLTRVQMDEDSWSTWAVGELYGLGPSFELVGNNVFIDGFDQQFTYAFAESAPDYLSQPGNAGLTDFSVMSEEQRAVISNAVNQWNNGLFGTGFGFELASNADEADVLIYNIRFDDDSIHAQGGNRSTDIGRDLLLNKSSNVFAADTPLATDRSTFEILRGLGQSLGLSTSDDLSRLRSVMGNRSLGSVSIPWPTHPLPEDIAVFRSENFFQTNPPERNVYWLGSASETPFFRTIVDSEFGDGNNNIVSAVGTSLPATIDLRGGRTSFVHSGTERPYNYANSIQSFIFDGYGGDSDDVLIGNFIGNKLIGGKGDDYLTGGGGSDSLFGGEGNDRYVFKPGAEQNLINEQSKGGTDTLEIEGLFNLDSLEDDLTFQKVGNSLNVRLDWDSQLDTNTDQIRIFNMEDPLSRVETLTLSNPDGQFARVDLNSVFTQADATRRRFEVIAQTSEFGNLVAPI